MAKKCYASKVISVALAEEGYNEKASNSNLDDKKANSGSGNWTKYGRDIDNKWPNFYNGKKNGYDWCDQFADWCFLTAFGYENALRLLCQPEKSLGAGCGFSARYYQSKNQFYKSNPKVGDQIFFQNSIGICHTGLVYKVDASKVYTIEGNTSNGVHTREYALNHSSIYGYGRPAYDVEATDTKPDTQKKKSITEVAKEVIDGKWGVGDDRKKKLTAAGYDYNAVQKKVNELLKANKATNTVHVVQKGETLLGIANKYNTTLAKLVKANGITNPNLIYPGQKITIV